MSLWDGWNISWLDIGCGNHPKGDVNCDIALEYYGLYNFVDVVCDAHNLPFRDNLFSTVSIFEVLEHCHSPYDVLMEIRRVLKPNGQLRLSIPNIQRWIRLVYYALGKKLHQTKEHIYAWETSTLEQFLERAGFKVLRHSYCDDDLRPRHHLVARRRYVEAEMLEMRF